MGKQKKKPPMPRWIWQAHQNIIRTADKHLLSYIWYFGDAGCPKWNWYLAKINRVSQSTIKRRLTRLHRLHLIAIVNPHYKRRRIYRLPYFEMKVWLEKKLAFEHSTGSSQLSYIYDLSEGNMYKTTYSPLGVGKETSPEGDVGDSSPQTPDGLCGQRQHSPHFEAVMEENTQISREAAENEARRRTELLGNDGKVIGKFLEKFGKHNIGGLTAK